MPESWPETLGAALRWGVDQLRPITRQPRLEAELLLAHLLECGRTYLAAHPEAPLAPEQMTRYAALVQQRAAGIPLPYLTGHIEFYGLEFAVTPHVLIPRPETELLVEAALEWLAERPSAAVVDLGTGSGCIAVTVARGAPAARLYAIDLSPEALAVAQGNAAAHGVAERITWLHGDLLAPLPQAVDLILSNPPYVAESEWEALPLSVRHEPRMALLAGADGLAALRRLLAQAPAHLRPGGRLLVEIGERQGDAAQALAQAAFPQAQVLLRRDLAGKERLLMVQSPTQPSE